MFVFNLKINKNSILKFCLIIMTVICLVIGVITVFKIINDKSKQKEIFTDNCYDSLSDVATINSNDYTNILKEVHEDIDTYIGQKISFTGYVYKINNFNKNQFVLARDMDIGNNQTLVVGFLCEYEDAENLAEYTWVNVVGTIEKTTYNNTFIPVLKVTEIKNVGKPDNPTVPVPNSEYIPTAVIY